MQQHLIKNGNFASLAALQDAAANFVRALEAADRMKNTKLDDKDTEMPDAKPVPQPGSSAAKRAAKAAKHAAKWAAKQANGDVGASTAGTPKKRKFGGEVGIGTPPSPCFHCGGNHWSKDCKSKRKDDDVPNGSKKAKFVPKSKANPTGTLTKKQLWQEGR